MADSSKSKVALLGHFPLVMEVAQRLDGKNYQAVIADCNEDNLATAREKGFEALRVDYTDDDELRRLGIGADIGTVFCLFSDDTENVFLTISARALSADVRIISVAESAGSIPKLTAAGADKIIDPYAISGRKLWEMVHRPLVAEILDYTLFGQVNLNLAEVSIPEDSFLCGRRLIDMDLSDRYNLVLLGTVDSQRRSEFVLSPRGLTRKLNAGDVLVVIGPSGESERLRTDLTAKSP